MHVIYVDDEQPAIDNFRLTVASFRDIESLHMFLDGEEALDWVKKNQVDIAFLDMEMQGIHGLKLANEMKKINQNIRIIFITAYNQYALDAFSVGAIGYIMKPYLMSDLRKEIDKAILVRDVPVKKVMIQTIPTFMVSVDGKALYFRREKVVELLALLVDKGERGITTTEGIAYLWPDRPDDTNTRSLFRITYKRLADALKEAEIGHIISSEANRRFIRVDQVDCDLYKILSGDESAARKYNGQYMQEYSWAEERNGQLHRILL